LKSEWETKTETTQNHKGEVSSRTYRVLINLDESQDSDSYK